MLNKNININMNKTININIDSVHYAITSVWSCRSPLSHTNSQGHIGSGAGSRASPDPGVDQRSPDACQGDRRGEISDPWSCHL